MSRINYLIPITTTPFKEWHAAEYGTGEVCTPAAVAQYLDIHKTTVWRWLEAGAMPGIRTARFWILMTADVDKWIADRLTTQAAEGAK